MIANLSISKKAVLVIFQSLAQVALPLHSLRIAVNNMSWIYTHKKHFLPVGKIAIVDISEFLN